MRINTCPADHKHGETPTCYRAHKCACRQCREANAERGRERKVLLGLGLPTSSMIPAATVQEHLNDLLAVGIPPGTIAAMSQVDIKNLLDIMAAPASHKIYPATREKILAVQADLESVPGDLPVSARGAQRRIRALSARGWTLNELARRLGWTDDRRENIDKIHRLQAWVHHAVSALYEEIWDTDPPDSTLAECSVRDRAIRRAQRVGWVLPMAWADIDRDDEPSFPEADPDLVDEVAIELALGGECVSLTALERQIVIDRAPASGVSDSVIAPVLGLSQRHILRLRVHKVAA